MITTIDIAGHKETIIERKDMPIEECKRILGSELTAVIGYGPQGRGQALNLRDQGFKVVVGVKKDYSYDNALKDGWKDGVNLLTIEAAAERGTIVQFLVSDAAQVAVWPTIQKYLTPKKALYFSHGFGIVYNTQTKIIPPKDVDVILVAPKGSGLTVRTHFLEGRGINASWAVHQDATGRAKERALATAFGIGCGHMFETTFEQEVTSDLTGERCVLMGLLQGAFKAQYDVLRSHGHSASEAYNETIEEALCSLYPLVAQNGMDWMYANCSTTAQRGALDWAPKFEAALKPVIEECYQSVKSGKEAARSISSNSAADYHEKLTAELKAMASQEMWQAGRVLRPLRPENAKK
jgi:ketol-acid reductoisomerase